MPSRKAGGLIALVEGSTTILIVELVGAVVGAGATGVAIFIVSIKSVVGAWLRGDLRKGTVVALIVEWRRFLEATGSLEVRLPVVVCLAKVRRELEVTVGVGWLDRPDWLVVAVFVVGFVWIFTA